MLYKITDKGTEYLDERKDRVHQLLYNIWTGAMFSQSHLYNDDDYKNDHDSSSWSCPRCGVAFSQEMQDTGLCECGNKFVSPAYEIEETPRQAYLEDSNAVLLSYFMNKENEHEVWNDNRRDNIDPLKMYGKEGILKAVQVLWEGGDGSVSKESVSREIDSLVSRGFLSVVNDDEFHQTVRDLMTKIKNDDIQYILANYLKLVYGGLSEDELDKFYDYCKDKIDKGVLIAREYNIEQKKKIPWSDKEEDQGSRGDGVIEFARLFSEIPNKKIACDTFIQLLHDRWGKTSFYNLVYFFFPDFFPDNDEEWNSDDYHVENDWGMFIMILDSLYSSDAAPDNYLDEDRESNENKYKWVLERNSEHKRRITKLMREEKQKTVVKRHIFRKGITG